MSEEPGGLHLLRRSGRKSRGCVAVAGTRPKGPLGAPTCSQPPALSSAPQGAAWSRSLFREKKTLPLLQKRLSGSPPPTAVGLDSRSPGQRGGSSTQELAGKADSQPQPHLLTQRLGRGTAGKEESSPSQLPNNEVYVRLIRLTRENNQILLRIYVWDTYMSKSETPHT